MPDMEHRETLAGFQRRDMPTTLATREDTTDGPSMKVGGVGVPYGDEVELFSGWFESIAPDAVQPRDHVMLFYRHRDPIGRVTASASTPTGWEYEATVSDVPAGREAHTLVKDGVIRSSSIGFYPIEWTETHDEAGVHIRHTLIDVREVSLVPIPAYDAATAATRSAITERNTTMPAPASDVTTELAEVREGLDEVTRAVAQLRNADDAPATNVVPLQQFSSFGDYVKRLAAGDELAARAFAGAVSGDTILHDAWVGDVIRLIEDRYKLTSLFRHTTDLPAEGMTLEYGLLESDTIKVQQQVAEGHDLAFGKVSLKTATAPVLTYGGWSALSRQAIERASVGILDITFRALAMRYGQAIELATRTLFGTAYTAAAASTADKVMLGGATPVALAAATPDAWLATVLDLQQHFDGKNYSLDGLVASKDVFLALAKVPEDKKMLQVTGAPDDKAGTLTVSVPSADLYGLRVTSAPFLAAGTLAAYDRQALRIQESPGAPWRLQDENIVNLTKQYSVYGYAAHYQQLAGGIVAIDTDGTK